MNTQETAPKRSLIEAMASKYMMEPKAFADAVRKTAMPSAATVEEFAAFLMVAKEYRLNPLLREIHAFPKKGGGIVPVVSIDGWVSLINQHPSTNGIEFEMHHNDKGALVAATCRIYRKDRDRPVQVTEYLHECFRNTEAWKMPHRMLRHKALIQAARYAFGFSGIYDEDEAQKIEEMRNVTPAAPTKLEDFSKVSALDAFAAQPEPEASPTDEPKPTLPTVEPLEATLERGEITPIKFADETVKAHAMGFEARHAGRALKAVPPEWRDDEHKALADHWQDGWKAADREIGKK